MGTFSPVGIPRPSIQQVGQLSIACPLPPGWKVENQVNEPTQDTGPPSDSCSGLGKNFWRHEPSGMIRDIHPMDPYFIELRDRRRLALDR